MMDNQVRQLATVIDGQNTSDGAGVKLKRIIHPQRHNFDPFILFDEFGSDEPADYRGGFPDHPHRGFETVTYMLEGSMVHRDHLGNEGHLRRGDVQWMTAAHGIIHSEMPEQENGLLHGFQLWLNLPASEKMKPPHYRDIAAKDIPLIELSGGSYVKLIAGEFISEIGKFSGAVTDVSTHPLYLDVLLSPGQNLDFPINPEHTVLIYVYKGELAFGISGKTLKSGQLGQLINGDHIQLETPEQSAQILVFAAMPLNEPVVQAGPFVMNTMEEIEQAYQDYRQGVLTRV